MIENPAAPNIEHRDVPTLLLAHGAGAGMDSPFMDDVAELLAERGVRVLRFEFPYMQQRRIAGSKRPPDRMPLLLEAYKKAIASVKGPLFIGGKSMGGRVATMLAADLDSDLQDKVQGVVAFGYPFHPAGKEEKLRIEHLPQIKLPTCIMQGERDKLGNRVLVEHLSALHQWPESISIHWLEDGDHDLKPRKASGYTHEHHIQQAAKLAAQFISQVVSQ